MIGMVTLFEMLFLGLVLFFVINYRISLKDETAQLNRQAIQTKHEIERYDREIEHLRLCKENLSRWSHIRNKIKQYNLALTVPCPGQIRQLIIVRNQPSSSKDMDQDSLMVSQR